MPTVLIPFEEIRLRFCAAIAAAVGLDPAVFDEPGTSVVASEERRGRGTAVVNQIGAHSLVWCDPVIVDRVTGLESARVPFPIDHVEAWAPSVGATFVGGARSLLVDSEMLHVVDPPDDARPIGLYRDDPECRALIAALLDATDADDVDAAEIEIDALDPRIVGMIDDEGALAAMASERPWEYDPVFGNIGVLVREDRRRGGWGRASVSIVAREVFADGRFPLYRCNWDRDASYRLALSLGFRQVSSLAAARFGGEEGQVGEAAST